MKNIKAVKSLTKTEKFPKAVYGYKFHQTDADIKKMFDSGLTEDEVSKKLTFRTEIVGYTHA